LESSWTRFPSYTLDPCPAEMLASVPWRERILLPVRHIFLLVITGSGEFTAPERRVSKNEPPIAKVSPGDRLFVLPHRPKSCAAGYPAALGEFGSVVKEKLHMLSL